MIRRSKQQSHEPTYERIYPRIKKAIWQALLHLSFIVSHSTWWSILLGYLNNKMGWAPWCSIVLAPLLHIIWYKLIKIDRPQRSYIMGPQNACCPCSNHSIDASLNESVSARSLHYGCYTHTTIMHTHAENFFLLCCSDDVSQRKHSSSRLGKQNRASTHIDDMFIIKFKIATLPLAC
jgi:hypothetical protein